MKITGLALFLLLTLPVLAQDGSPTPALTPTPGHHRPGGGGFMKRFDTNGDGKLDPQERDAMIQAVLKRHPELLQKFDANGDGKLDDNEKAALIKSFQERMQQRRQQRQQQGRPTPASTPQE